MVIYNGAGFEKWIEEVDSEFIVDTSKNIDLIDNDKELILTYGLIQYL